jgi:hypothetical protein
MVGFGIPLVPLKTGITTPVPSLKTVPPTVADPLLDPEFEILITAPATPSTVTFTVPSLAAWNFTGVPAPVPLVP